MVHDVPKEFNPNEKSVEMIVHELGLQRIFANELSGDKTLLVAWRAA